MRNLSLIIKREFNSRVRNKSFVVMTILSPLIFVGMIFLVAYLSSLNNEEIRSVAVLDNSGFFENTLEDSDNIIFKKLEDIDLYSAKIISEEGDYHGLLFIPESNDISTLDQNVEFYLKCSPSVSVVKYIEKSLNATITNLKLERDGVDLLKIEASKSNVDLKIENFTNFFVYLNDITSLNRFIKNNINTTNDVLKNFSHCEPKTYKYYCSGR